VTDTGYWFERSGLSSKSQVLDLRFLHNRIQFIGKGVNGNGGKMQICVPCIKARNIEDADLIDGVEITAAGALNIEAMGSGAVFVY